VQLHILAENGENATAHFTFKDDDHERAEAHYYAKFQQPGQHDFGMKTVCGMLVASRLLRNHIAVSFSACPHPT